MIGPFPRIASLAARFSRGAALLFLTVGFSATLISAGKDITVPPRPPEPHAPIDMPGAPKAASGSVNQTDTVTARLDASPTLRAMAHELKRSMDSLRIKGRPRPYFISYLLWDVESHHMQASMGSCEMSDDDRQHMADVDLRVGDYNEDNTDFQGGIVFGPRLRLPYTGPGAWRPN